MGHFRRSVDLSAPLGASGDPVAVGFSSSAAMFTTTGRTVSHEQVATQTMAVDVSAGVSGRRLITDRPHAYPAREIRVHAQDETEQDGYGSDDSMPGLISVSGSSEVSHSSSRDSMEADFFDDEVMDTGSATAENTTPQALVLRFGYVCPLCLWAGEDVSTTKCGHVFCTRYDAYSLISL